MALTLTYAELLDEYWRYRDASPNLPEASRMRLAERILRQMKDCVE